MVDARHNPSLSSFFIPMDGNGSAETSPGLDNRSTSKFLRKVARSQQEEPVLETSKPHSIKLNAYVRRERLIQDRKKKLAAYFAMVREKKEQVTVHSSHKIRDHERRLRASLDFAERKRKNLLETVIRDRSERNRRQRESVAQMRLREQKDLKDFWESITKRDYIVRYRRERLKTIPRSKLLDTDLKTDRLDDAAETIVNAWIDGRLLPFVKEFETTKVFKLAMARDYEQMKRVMMEKTVIQKATGLILQIISCDPVARALTRPVVSGRILLTAILLDRFSSEVLPDPTPEELLLLENASLFTEFFRFFLQERTRKKQQALVERWLMFLESFTKWQKRSKAVLLGDLKRDYVNLQEMLIKLTPEARLEWMEHIKKHQLRIQKAVMRLEGARGLLELEAQLANLQMEEEDLNQISNESSKESATTTVDAKIIKELEESVGKSKESTLSKIQIAHELVVNPQFDYREHMSVCDGEAGFDSSVVNEETFVDFIVLLKNHMMEMVNHKGRLAVELEECMNENFLREQVASGSLEQGKLLFFATQKMAEMCAPVRDDTLKNINAKLESGEFDVAVICQELLKTMQLMHQDLAMVGVQMIRPRLQTIIIQYEREWFAANVLNKPTPYAKNFSLLLSSVFTHLNPKEKMKSLMIETWMSLMGFPGEKLIEVSADIPAPHQHELMQLDAKRLGNFESQLHKIVNCSALSLALRNLKHPKLSNICTRLRILVFEGSADICSLQDEACFEIKDGSQTDLIKNTVERIMKGRDPIVQLLRRRIYALLRAALASDSIESVNRPESTLIRSGIVENLGQDYNRLSENIYRAYRLHCQVLQPVYYGLIKNDS